MKRCWVVLALLLTVVLSGCLGIPLKTMVVRDESERIDIQFESTEAADLFESKRMAEALDEHSFYRGRSSFGCLFVVVERPIVYETSRRNALMRQADINADGMITLKEAEELLVASGDWP